VYTVRGHITGPAGFRRSGATLYLHGLGLGEWLWNFPVKRHSFVRAIARTRHVSVSIDRLGYGQSGRPPSGRSVCIGAQADVAHQIVEQLKAGSYMIGGGGQPRRFKRVALVGHSAAGQISITEAYTYRDLAALVVVGFSFSNLPLGNEEFGQQRIACDRGGDVVSAPPQPTLTDYAFFGRTGADFRRAMFRSAPRSVQNQAIGLHYPDPCGDNYSLIDTIAQQAANVRKVRVPVLVACGRNDVLYSPFGCVTQADRFRRGRSLLLANTGHAAPLERGGSILRRKLGRFLDRYGL
jgi:pimeloyl-ACP methyl ester carboxylesterase